jgi:hypothetical protein
MLRTNRELREGYLGYQNRGNFMTYVTHLLLQEECHLEGCVTPDFWNMSAGACKFLLENPFKKQSQERKESSKLLYKMQVDTYSQNTTIFYVINS